jgi:5-methylcytosine-specific restriction endonuclease McrA
MDFIAKFPVDEILPLLSASGFEKEYTRIGEYRVRINSLRLRTFKTKGITCSHCGLTGEYFILERHRNQEHPHLNLYAVDKKGKPILMTQDHIQPKSKGGKDTLCNSQVLCKTCNEEKGDTWEN